MSLQDPLNTDERDWSAPTRSAHTIRNCRGCAITLIPSEVQQWSGWPYCTPCYREITTLAMSPEDRSHQSADEFVDEMNRSRR